MNNVICHQERRQKAFLVIASIFLGVVAILNVIGITRIVQVGPFTVAAGTLAYPLTFLCTDLISELWGRKQATFLVWMGLVTNILVVGLLALIAWVPSVPLAEQPPWQTLYLARDAALPGGETLSGAVEPYWVIYSCTVSGVVASMVAYIGAQFLDVHLFHWWKKLTQGRHLWLRNNGSTLISQLFDSILVTSVIFGPSVWSGAMAEEQFIAIVFGTYGFKFVAALVDTGPLYLLVSWFRRYFGESAPASCEPVPRSGDR